MKVLKCLDLCLISLLNILLWLLILNNGYALTSKPYPPRDTFDNKQHFVIIKENDGETEFIHYSHAVNDNKSNNNSNNSNNSAINSTEERKEKIDLTRTVNSPPTTPKNSSIKDQISQFFSLGNKNILNAFALPIKFKVKSIKKNNGLSDVNKKNKTKKYETPVKLNFNFFDDTSKKITENFKHFMNRFGWTKSKEKEKVEIKTKINDKNEENGEEEKNGMKNETKTMTKHSNDFKPISQNKILINVSLPLFQHPLNSSIKLAETLQDGVIDTTTAKTDVQDLQQEKNNCICGEPTEQSEENGHNTTIQQFPWNVRIFYKDYDDDFCGGAIINDRYVLTAAHCVMFMNRDELAVRIGYNDPSDPGEAFDVDKIKVHKRYSVNKMGVFDIAIIRLQKQLTYSPKVQAVCLVGHLNFNRKKGIITSWGPLSNAQEATDTLRKASVVITEYNLCRKHSHFSDEDLHSSVVCADITKESCGGDSGNPLVHFDGSKYVLVGIRSWGIGCAYEGLPVVYTKIPNYFLWITQNTADAKGCSYRQIKK
ncbi:UNVERIFIED_CONTAM: hypothetical protein RMT77_000595 [Armadillidium vulgare]